MYFSCLFRLLLLSIILSTPCYTKDLTIYIRDSFDDTWRQPLESAYAPLGKLHFVRLSGTALRARLLLEGKNTKADLVMGLDSLYCAQIEETGCVRPCHIDKDMCSLPARFDSNCVPFCYGYLTLLTHAKERMRVWRDMESFEAHSLVFPSPFTSSVGVVFWHMVMTQSLSAKHIKHITRATPKGLPQTFGLFLNQKARVMFSFSTFSQEKTPRKITSLSLEAHPILAYTAFVTPRADKDAGRLLEMILSAPLQSMVWEKDHLYPVNKRVREAQNLEKHALPACPQMISLTQQEQLSVLQHFQRTFS